MYGEYGYMEEGPLGKAYNLRLLKRLARYALPYKKVIVMALCLTMMITLLNLALPYLSKIAIDRYILASWYRVNLTDLEAPDGSDLLKRVSPLLEKSEDGAVGFITHVDMKNLDPADLQRLKIENIISNSRFYRVRIDARDPVIAPHRMGPLVKMADGSVVIPMEAMKGMTTEELIKVRGSDIRGVAMVGLTLLILLFMTFGLGCAEYYLLEWTGQRIMQDIRLQLFQEMQRQSVSFFTRNPVGRLVTRATNDVENLNEMFKSVAITVFKDIFIIAGIIAVLLYLNWRLALACFTLIPFIFGMTLLFSFMAREAFRELRATVARINAFLQERITGMRIIHLFAREAYQMAQFVKINHQNYLAGMKQIRVFAVFMPLMEIFASFAVALLIWHGGGKVIGEQLTLGSLVAFLSYIRMFFRPIRDISEKYNIMQSAMASTERIFEFMDHEEVVPEPLRPKTPKPIEGHLEFREVSFAYQVNRPILKNISFEVNPGEMVAIVGATGAGKTTVVNLIERFYDVNEGEILLDGVDIREWSKRELRTQIGLVMQDVFIFSGNLSDNISLQQEHVGREAVVKAAEEANAYSFIKDLPQGLQHEIGEGGSNLSGGERQLLSFARALAYDPKVLILDEATSSVDPETEHLIQSAILKMSKKRTTLVVAHRLSTIRKADRILVMHQGRIREEGTHEALLALDGIYARLNSYHEAKQ